MIAEKWQVQVPVQITVIISMEVSNISLKVHSEASFDRCSSEDRKEKGYKLNH